MKKLVSLSITLMLLGCITILINAQPQGGYGPKMGAIQNNEKIKKIEADQTQQPTTVNISVTLTPPAARHAGAY